MRYSAPWVRYAKWGVLAVVVIVVWLLWPMLWRMVSERARRQHAAFQRGLTYFIWHSDADTVDLEGTDYSRIPIRFVRNPDKEAQPFEVRLSSRDVGRTWTRPGKDQGGKGRAEASFLHPRQVQGTKDATVDFIDPTSRGGSGEPISNAIHLKLTGVSSGPVPTLAVRSAEQEGGD
jgi:hypothetical protein